MESEIKQLTLPNQIREVCDEWVAENGVGPSSDWHVLRLLPLAEEVEAALARENTERPDGFIVIDAKTQWELVNILRDQSDAVIDGEDSTFADERASRLFALAVRIATMTPSDRTHDHVHQHRDMTPGGKSDARRA